MTKVIYIAGYGRSGSTILDMLLGMHPDIAGCGELAHIFDEWINAKLCSCRKEYDNCPYWLPIVQAFKANFSNVTYEEALQLTRKIETVPTISNSAKDRKQYAEIWQFLIKAISDRANVSTIVDSSKSTRLTARRATTLGNIRELDINIIHLCRDPRAVLWSSLQGANRKLEAGYTEGKSAQYRGGIYRTILSWTATNFYVHVMQRVQEMPFVQVRYEDLVAEPLVELERIGAAFNLDMQPVQDLLKEGDPLMAGHGIAGNRLRRKGVQKLEIKNEWYTKLPRKARQAAWLGWPLAKYYGYKFR